MVDLPESLALVEAQLNDEARTAFQSLFSGEMKERLVNAKQKIDSERKGPDPYQEQLLSGFVLPEKGPEQLEDRQGDREQNEFQSHDGPDSGGSGLVALLAMLCVTGPKEKVAQLLVRLPLHLQGAMIPKMLRTSPLNATSGLKPMHRDLVEELREAMPEREEWGFDSVAKILGCLELKGELRRLISAADAVDHESVVMLQNHLFDFVDLLHLSDRDMQTLLVQVDNEKLGLALRGAELGVRQGVFGNVSVRRRSMIAEEMERWAEATIEEIESAQQQIMAVARHLYDQGKIKIYFGSVSGLASLGVGIAEEEDENDQVAESEVIVEEQEGEPKKEKSKFRSWILGIMASALAVSVVWGLSRILGGGVESEKSSDWGSSGGGIFTGERSSSTASEAEGTEDREQRPADLLEEPGAQTLQIQALVEVPGRARVEALSRSEVVLSDKEDNVLEMRVGKVRTMVLDEDFELRTPVVKIRGIVRGAVFETRVVLNAATSVEVIRGMVEVRSSLRDGQRWVLGSGMRGYFDTAGNGEIEKNEE